MYKEKEIKEDVDRLVSMAEALKLKYGEDFACLVSAGAKTEEYFAGVTFSTGNEEVLHQVGHSILQSPKNILTIMDAMECILLHKYEEKDRSEISMKILSSTIELLKKDLVMETDDFKKAYEEHEAEESVKRLLEQTGFPC